MDCLINMDWQDLEMNPDGESKDQETKTIESNKGRFMHRFQQSSYNTWRKIRSKEISTIQIIG